MATSPLEGCCDVMSVEVVDSFMMIGCDVLSQMRTLLAAIQKPEVVWFVATGSSMTVDAGCTSKEPSSDSLSESASNGRHLEGPGPPTTLVLLVYCHMA